MITIKKLNTLTQRIEYVLDKEPMARDSDLYLQATLCEWFMPPFERPITNWTEYVNIMRTLPSLDHIARARRIVIQKHNYTKYLPTNEEVAKARKIAEDVWLAYTRQQNISKPVAVSANYPPDIQDKLERTGQTGIDD